MKRYLLFLLIFILSSCGYPDIDNVPDFKDVTLTDEEVEDYCNNSQVLKKNIDKCINDIKSKN